MAKKKATRSRKTDVKPSRKTAAPLTASRALARKLARLADDRRCRDVVVLEVQKISPVATHFVIATGTSDQQIRAVAREMQDVGTESGFKTFGCAGMQQGRWVVIDMVDVVVHLFDEEYRQFYDLELLWGDAPKLRWQRPRRKESAEKT